MLLLVLYTFAWKVWSGDETSCCKDEELEKGINNHRVLSECCQVVGMVCGCP